MEEEKRTETAKVEEQDLEKLSGGGIGGDFEIAPLDLKDDGLVRCPYCKKWHPRGEKCLCQKK